MERSKTKDKPPETRNKRLEIRAIQNFILWVLICGFLIAIIFVIHHFIGSNHVYVPRSQRYGIDWHWASILSLIIAIIGFNIASADILKHLINKHGRNVIAWTTSIIVFTPFLATIAYLLTWPKNHRLTGLEG